MRIVVNAGFGGFSLSDKAERRYAELAGFEFTRFEQTGWKHNGDEGYRVIGDEEENIFSHTIRGVFEGDFTKLPYTQGQEGGEGSYWSSRATPRDDKFLLQVVDEMGEDANGRYAKLRVVEIPDEVEWEIDEYDGSESVHEKHQVWYP